MALKEGDASKRNESYQIISRGSLVIQFLGNYLLAVYIFFTKSYPRDRVRDGIIPGQLLGDCIGTYSDDYGRRTSVVSRSCEMVSQEKHFTVMTVSALRRASSRKNVASIFYHDSSY